MEGAEALSAHRGAAEVSFNFEEGVRGAGSAPLFSMAHRAIRLGHCSPRTAVTIETATDQPTFSKFMGIRILEISPDSVKAELPIREDFKNRGGVMHGGAVMAFADSLGGTTANANLREGQRTTTIESKT